MKRTGTMVVLLAFLMIPSVSHADPTSISAPYWKSSTQKSCSALTLNAAASCTTTVRANPNTGRVDMDGTITSRLDGKLPGSGVTSGEGLDGISMVLRSPAQAIRFTALVHIDSATATRDPAGLLNQSLATVTVEGFASSDAPCDASCTSIPGGSVVADDEPPYSQVQAPPYVENADVTITSTIQSCSGNLGRGSYTFMAGARGIAGLSDPSSNLSVPAAGSAHFDFDGAISSISYEIVPRDPQFCSS